MKDKTILITGGTTGIGLATAQLLSSEGATVIITGQNPNTLSVSASQLPSGTIVIKSDAGSLDDIRLLPDQIKEHADGLDGLFLNAGVFQKNPFPKATVDQFESIFNVNVRGPFFQLQGLLPLLNNPSAVVLNSSVAASRGLPETSLYSATKAAITSFGKTLAVELAPRGVRVNVLSPGPIETPIYSKIEFSADAKRDLAERSLLKRIGRPEEVAKLARFLLSNDSSFIIGEEVVADGGSRWA